MSLLDVDLAAPHRVEGIAAEGLRALGAVRERSSEVDEAVDEMFERQERTRRELDEQVRQAAAEGDKPEEKADEDRPKPKRTLSLGGDEFHQARETNQAEAPKPALPPKPAVPPQSTVPPPPAPEPEPRDEAPNPARTLKLGARDDAEDEAPQPNRTTKLGARDDEEPQREQRQPRRPRPPRPEGDDDMSGRTWLR
ncbi:hypothetical protein [Actinophytocola algeriensis]|uniref:Sec-independent protein translocase protein TatA n=1 Tax=Actinophytocola algeriensis TaxID=1768010 RepID=A0A7W7QEI4_9PSEU|nr:hypothetical protein [Actinophytocola algeriensis]MBB4912039.1 Sec-independent protein translocase protein TatA [Actinophytocola algeriensis]MBE1477469.1 Sec-independent protein translocase protein TatA [Actinophytocola algeriensis]